MISGIGDSPQYALSHLVPDRIRRARERAGYTGVQLAAKIEKEPSSVSQFESGRMKPSLETLIRLSLALGVPCMYMAERPPSRTQYKISFDDCHFRARRKASQKERRASIRHAEDVLDLIEYFHEQNVVFPNEEVSSFRYKLSPFEEDDFEAIETIASGLREHWGLGFGPIPHLVHLLESRGILVIPLVAAHVDVDAFSTWASGSPCIMLANNKSASRSRFDAGHELGHLVMHDDTHPGLNVAERQAHRFAGAFLAPREAFYAECPRTWDMQSFFTLKSRWKLSVAALVRRAYDLGCISQSTYTRAYKHLNAAGKRRNEGEEWPREKPAMISQSVQLLGKSLSLEGLSRELSLHPASVEALLKANNVTAAVLTRLRAVRKEASIVHLKRSGKK